MINIRETNVLHIEIQVIHSEWDDALGGPAILRTKNDAIQTTLKAIAEIMENGIPEDMACSLILARK